ncbi:hypothetical protein NL64_06390 [Pseudomonas fluorescens]|uniref:TAXI family TRAP transporter solute-binding subunit n=1 Tax=Pseudomonas fluorescens TaxID=294 RepID=UPI00054C09DE|nr:TAXI family TRAP transporter solute-binding subunit [Pseudomonas fluorescens]KII34884.1 hypothetical protein NL64_06390 [Pseudomonas fluorescens]
MKSKALLIIALLGASALAHAAAPASLNFCSGGKGGFYESLAETIGKKIVKDTPTELHVLNTGGSVENAQKMKAGKCDIAVIQADVVSSGVLPNDVKVTDAHTEVVYWLHGKSGVDDFGKMEKDSIAAKYAFASVQGSGALTTVKNWIKTDKDYEGARVIEFDNWYSAAEAVAQGFTTTEAGVRIEIAGMLYIGRAGKISSDITEDFGTQILIGEVNDDSFANSKDINGNPLYSHCDIDKLGMSGLESSTMGKPDTYCVRAQLVYNNAWHQGLSADDQRDVRRAVDKGINSTVKAVR